MSTSYLHSAVRLLHRREQSALELRQKLLQKGATVDEADAVVWHCQEHGWQSDDRFVSVWLRHGYQKGQGLQKLRYELQSQHQIEPWMIERALKVLAFDWFALAEKVLAKKLDGKPPGDAKQRLKAYQFMTRRGFDADAIQCAMETLKST